MTAPQNSPEILDLSPDAQAVLAGPWGFSVNFTLTMGNQVSRLSTRAKIAMQDLIDADIINEDKADDGYAESRTYSLSEKGKGLEFRKPLDWIAKHGEFLITEIIND
jgi:hypothetical protein